MRILFYIVEVLVLAFIITAIIFISKQSKVTDKEQKQSADSASNINIDKLNNLDYLDKFDEDSTAVDSSSVDSLRK